MSEFVSMLTEWHKKFGVPISPAPMVPAKDRRELRVDLIREEFREFWDASDKKDVVGVADACADLMYVIIGAALEWGIPLDDVFREVHRSNMSKVWPDGTVHYRDDGKVLKPPTYSPADITSIIYAARGTILTSNKQVDPANGGDLAQ